MCVYTRFRLTTFVFRAGPLKRSKRPRERSTVIRQCSNLHDRRVNRDRRSLTKQQIARRLAVPALSPPPPDGSLARNLMLRSTASDTLRTARYIARKPLGGHSDISTKKRHAQACWLASLRASVFNRRRDSGNAILISRICLRPVSTYESR